jgi:carboxypeptidase C (cathepsin A)
MKMKRWICCLWCALAFSGLAEEAQSDEAKDDKEKPAEKEKKTDKEEAPSVTHHKVVIAGKEIAYTATAGTLPIMASNDKDVRAHVFYIAYTLDDVEDSTKRPVTFSFNGGPGSSAVWLHMGVFGPRRVKLNDDGSPPPPPYHLVDNEFSMLDKTDLVFIDPVSTGYSRATDEKKAKEFHGVAEDIESVGEFIRLYITRHNRWGSPKYVGGESYGTLRAAGLSGHLQQRHGMFLNGLLLVSSVLEFQTLRFGNGNDLPYVLFLPSYTAAAWYHKKLPPDLQQKPLAEVLKLAEAFAMDAYSVSLLKGASLPEADYVKITKQLARFTGLSEAYIAQANNKVSQSRFSKELLRDERRTVGRMDSRFKGVDSDAAGESMQWDPSLTGLMGPFTATFKDYVRRELAYEKDMPYEILSRKVHPWSYDAYENKYVNVAGTLREAITHNPALKIFVGSGYADMATPYLATDYTLNRLGLEPHLRANIQTYYYDAGHMMYANRPDLEKLKRDLDHFFKKP